MGSRVNKDPISLLQLALPIEDLKGENQVRTVRELQLDVENVKANTLLRLWNTCLGSAQDASNIAIKKKEALLKPVSADRRAEAEAVLAKLVPELQAMTEAVEKGIKAEQGTFREDEASAASTKSVNEAQRLIGELEETMLPKNYAAPVAPDVEKDKDFKDLPRLNGRAVVEMKLKRAEGGGQKKFTLDDKVFEEVTLQIIADGWSAPISAGNFVDLVDKGFYNGMAIQRADGFIIQTGDSGDADEHGYRPAKGGKVRRIPLEVAVTGKKQALYGETIDEARMVGAQVRIPFQADGVVSMARAEFDNDSASSQFFMIIFESDMTPAGKNLLDGRYGSFGYTVEGADFLRQVAEGDVIVSAKVLSGIEKLNRA